MLEKDFFVAGSIIEERVVNIVQRRRDIRDWIIVITSHLILRNCRRTGNENFRGGRQQQRKLRRNERLLER